jgi:hypothetical protein
LKDAKNTDPLLEANAITDFLEEAKDYLRVYLVADDKAPLEAKGVDEKLRQST